MPAPPTHNGTEPAGEWPLRTFLELGALPSTVPCARYHTRQVLWEWHLTEHADSAELIVSEIATNAIQASGLASQPAVVRLWLLSDRHGVLILVWDVSPHPPAPMAHASGQSREGGWGLVLVDSFSDQWSCYSVADGKVVWTICGDGKCG